MIPKRIVFLFFFCLLFRPFCFDNKIDSLFNKVYLVLDENRDSAVLLVNEFKADSDHLSKGDQLHFFGEAALFYYKIGDFIAELDCQNRKINLLPENSDTLYVTMIRVGFINLTLGNGEVAWDRFKACEAFYINHPSPKKLALVYDGMAAVKGSQGKGEEAVDYYIKSITYNEQTNDYECLSKNYCGLMGTYRVLKDEEKALEMAQKAHYYAKLSDSEFDIELTGLWLGESYVKNKRLDSALIFLNNAKDFFEEFGNLFLLNIIYGNLGEYHALIGEYTLSEANYLKAIEIIKTIDSEVTLASTLGNYSAVLSFLGKYQEGVKAGREAIEIAERSSFPEMEAQINQALYLNYKGLAKFDSALYYHERFRALQDSIQDMDNQKAMIRKEMKHVHQKEKDGIISEAEMKIERESRLKFYWLVGFLSLLLVSAALYWAFRQKKKSEQLILTEKEYLDNLLHNFVHEFRTPLTLIKGPTEELLKKDENSRLLQMINKNSEQMLLLVNQILDFAKIKAGRLQVRPDIINLPLFYDSIISQFSQSAAKKQISLLTDYHGAVMIKADDDKIFKVVTNLLGNAIKYSEAGATVTLRSIVEGEKLMVSVIDTGVGIAKVDQEKVFTKFYQVDATMTRKGEGTGLGLTFVKELVTLMQGKINLQSELGKGTRVDVDLPVEIIVGEPANMENKKNEVAPLEEFPADQSVNSQHKILVIEDNDDMQDFIAQLLQEKQYDVYRAENGQVGVELALEVMPDLIISDVMMPVMDGYQVVQTLKNNTVTDHIPIMMLTAKASFDSMLNGLQLGADDYISKPFKSGELLLRISNALDRQEKLRQKFSGHPSSYNNIVKPEIIRKIEDVVTNDLLTHISVEELAEQCAMSRSQLHRKIKSLTGLSTTELITKIRLDLAIKDIQTTSMTVSEVAYKYGYSDPAYFSRLFKKQFNVTPSEARKTGA